MKQPAVFRNALISGLLLFLMFYIFKETGDTGNRTMDSISSPRSTAIFVSAMFLPGFLFGLAVLFGLRGKSKPNKWLYVPACGILYIALAFPAVLSPTNALITSALGGAIAVFLFHFLVAKVSKLPLYMLLGLVVGLVSILPLHLGISSGSDLKGMSDSVLPFILFPAWQGGIGALLAISVDNMKDEG